MFKLKNYYTLSNLKLSLFLFRLFDYSSYTNDPFDRSQVTTINIAISED